MKSVKGSEVRSRLRAGARAGKPALVASLLAIAACLAMSATAGAQTTHKLLETWNTPVGSEPQVQAVDKSGDVYVYNTGNNTVSKYSPTGAPIAFSALGSNTIDGEGGPNCPAVPADCDRVPVGHIGDPSYSFTETDHLVAVDDSNGPASGYIYVINQDGGRATDEEGNPISPIGAVEVFAPSGKFMGELNRSITFPHNSDEWFGPGGEQDVTTDRNGHVYVDYCCASDTMDQYAAVDGNPAHDVFVGQLRTQGFCCQKGMGGAGYSYTLNNGWEQAEASAFLVQSNFTPTVRTGSELWGGLGATGYGFTSLSIDPRNEDVYLTSPGSIVQWDKDSTHQIGPPFGEGSNGIGIGFDTSGGPDDGHLYIRGTANGGNSVAVFSGPVKVPDVSYGTPEAGHFSAVVHAHIALDGGPPATSCKVEYGKEYAPFSTSPAYERGSIPCSPSVPYAGDTDVSVELPSLLTETDYHYRVVVSNENGTIVGKDQVVHTVAVLSATTEPATNITTTEATLNGKLDPDGMQTEYHFEYGLTENYDNSTPTETIGPGSGLTAVTPADLTQLQPGRTYHFALVASNSLGTTVANDRTLVPARTPRISGVRTTEVAETSAELHARINPFGYDTTYRFEYGPSMSYGSSIPVPDADIGSGSTPEEVSIQLAGLAAGTQYHFRVVAINKWGTSFSDDTTFSYFPPDCPNSHIRQVTGSNYLPDCRAYEMVSPDNAAGVQLFPGEMTQIFGGAFLLNAPNSPYRISSTNTGLASSPSRLAFWGSFGALPGTNPPNSLIDMYVASRTSHGWVTTYPGIPGSETPAAGRPTCDVSMDKCIDYSVPGPFNFAGFSPHNAPYVWDTSGNSASLGRWPTNLGSIPDGQDFIGDQRASGDFSHYVFSSRDLAFAPGGLTKAPGSVYDNDVADKKLTIVSQQENGEPIEQDGGSAQEYIKVLAVSTDGARILMATDSTSGAENIYLREDDSVTYEFPHGVRVLGMTRSGSQVIFVSNNQLTPEDTDTSADIYVWNASTDSLTLVSQGNGQGDSDQCQTTWVAKCGAKQITPERKDTDNLFAPGNGDPVFYSPENLDENTPGVHNQRNLYEWYKGRPQLITTLDPGTEVSRIQVSPDGAHIAFRTNSRVTGYDNAGYQEIYTYDADSEALTCASCIPDGRTPTADVQASGGGLFMSDDGRTFFSTTDALVPQDTNNGIVDVYEYVDGRPQLITSGTGLTDLYAGGIFYPPVKTGLEGVSADGIDVYFTTFDTLSPEDHNGRFVKFYDARSGGGFPTDPGLQPCVAADECHGEGSEPGSGLQVGTGAALSESGSTRRHKAGQKATKKPRKKRHGRHRRGSHRSHRHG